VNSTLKPASIITAPDTTISAAAGSSTKIRPDFLSGSINFYEYVENSPLGFNDPNGLQAQAANTCCDQQKIKNIQQDLQNAFSGAAAAKSKVFQKYKPCLQKMLGDMSFQCGPPPPNKPSECGGS